MPAAKMKVDYLIIGQGIAGTLLSYELLQAGKSVLVLDNQNIHRSSLVAGAVINPLAGKGWSRSPDADRFIPKAVSTYRSLESLLGIDIVRETDLLIFYQNEEGKQSFAGKQHFPEGTYSTALSQIVDPFFNNKFGAEQVKGLWLVDAAGLLDQWHKYLTHRDSYRATQFDQAMLTINDGNIVYGDIEAGSIIFCDGAVAAQNALFSALPFTRNRGEALLLRIPDLPQKHIYHRSVRLVPKGNDQYWCGSNYKWDFENLLADEQWKQETIAELQSWLKIPFTIIDHIVAQRPTTAGQFPLIGHHPKHTPVAIFNGMGTRGFSAGPYWANAFADVLTGKTNHIPDYDHARFRKFFPA
jgi:glycine/D-amino acid oxidase-like deaminating enzyme